MKLKKYVSLLAATALFAGFLSMPAPVLLNNRTEKTNGIVLASNSVPAERVCVDYPNGTYYGDVAVCGWAISHYGVKRVDIYVDGKGYTSVMNSSMTARSDIQRIFGSSGYSDTAHSGYSCTVKGLSNGRHNVRVAEIDKQGHVVWSGIRYFTVSTPPERICVDYPNGTYYGDVTVSGWAISHYGVERVDVYVDGKGCTSVKNSSMTSRSDIVKLFGSSGYSDTAHSGFSYTMSGLSNGRHSVRVAEIDNQGHVVWSGIRYFTVSTPPERICVDYPNGTYYGDVTVSGWAISHYGVERVDVYVDGKGCTSVKNSSMTSRSDIVKLFGSSGYPDTAHSGYSYTIAGSSLSVGSHTVRIAEIDNKGNVVWSGARTFKMLGDVNYKSFNTTVNNVVKANKGATVSNIDPVKVINDGGLYEFVTLKAVGGFSASELAPMLENCGVMTGHAKDFIDAGNKYNVNPVYLIAHARLETGNGTSHFSDFVYNGVHYHNLFGICAYDDATSNAMTKAISENWNSIRAAAFGGAEFIAKEYVNSSQYYKTGYDQDTLYFMKWNPEGYIKKGYATNEYATSSTWASGIAGIIKQYSYVFKGKQVSFVIPKYK